MFINQFIDAAREEAQHHVAESKADIKKGIVKSAFKSIHDKMPAITKKSQKSKERAAKILRGENPGERELVTSPDYNVWGSDGLNGNPPAMAVNEPAGVEESVTPLSHLVVMMEAHDALEEKVKECKKCGKCKSCASMERVEDEVIDGVVEAVKYMVPELDLDEAIVAVHDLLEQHFEVDLEQLTEMITEEVNG